MKLGFRFMRDQNMYLGELHSLPLPENPGQTWGLVLLRSGAIGSIWR